MCKKITKEEAEIAASQILYDVTYFTEWDTNSAKEWEALQEDIIKIISYLRNLND